MEYLEDLFNPTSTPSCLEAEFGDFGMDSPISGADVTEVVKKLLGSTVLGVD